MIGYEHERRFLCLQPDLQGPGTAIRQAYLSARKPTVRIRLVEGRYVLTFKGDAAREVEIDLDQAHGSALFAMARRHAVEKRRHVVNGWEIDVFAGRLAGLVIAEIELEQPDSVLPAPPPGVTMLREITGMRKLSNSRLSRLSVRAARELIADLYEPFGHLDATQRIPG